MKTLAAKIGIIAFLFFISWTSSAQDIIFKTDGSEINCRIKSSNLPLEIQYYKLDNASQVYSIDRSYVHHVYERSVYLPDTTVINNSSEFLIGIGTIIDTTDYTSGTFDLFRFFADHPIIINGKDRARLVIVDHPSEAEYSITGLIEGFIKLAVVTDQVVPPFRYNYNLTFIINIWHNGKIIKKITTNARDYLSDEDGKVINVNSWPPPDLKYYIFTKLFEKAQQSIVDIINKESGKALTIWNFPVSFSEPILTKTYLANLSKRKVVFYPYKTLGYFTNEREMDPWDELREFDINFKVGLPFEKYHSTGFEGNYEGLAQLNFPVWIRPEAAFEYIMIGDNFYRLGYNSVAAKSYWSALTLISKTFSSRNVKEKIRLLAYAGLFNVAFRKNQKGYANLFRVAMDMIYVYLKGQQGIDDEAIFNREMQKARDAEVAKKKAQQAAQWQGLVSTFQVGMSIGGSLGNMANMTSATEIINSGITLVGKVDAQNASMDQTARLQEEINQRLTNNYKSLRSQIGDDATTSYTGSKDFLAEEVIFFLATSNSTDPYLAIIKKFSSNFPGLQSALDQFENNYDPVESVLRIGEEVSKIEHEIILREKIRK